MSSNWVDAFGEAVRSSGIEHRDFAAIVSRLLNHGAICPEDSKVEEELYRKLKLCEDVVADYLHVLGFYLHHNRDLEYFRLYPPGSAPAGQPVDDDPVGGFSARPSHNLVALLLTLRFLYEKKLAQGDLTDATEAPCSIEEIGIVMHQMAKRELPSSSQEQHQLFGQAARAKVLVMPKDRELSSQDDVLYIRPHILELVTDEHLGEISGDGAADEAEVDEEEVPDVD